MLPPPNHPSVVTAQPQAQSAHGARPKQPKGEVVKFYRELNSDDARMADELYEELRAMHHSNRSDHSWHCAVKHSTSDTLVGFRQPGRKPDIIQVHDKGNPYLGRGAYGYVYESSQLLRTATGGWGIPEGGQYKRVMKIQENSDDAQSEVYFQLEQPGSLGAGRVGDVYYLDQLRFAGNCMDKYFKDEKWPLKNRFECAVAMLKCAQVYEAAGKVHPDIKPENMIYDPGEKEINFVDNAHVRDLYLPGVKDYTPRGTPLFISPEQYIKQDISPKAMVYSLGIILLNLFSDKPGEYGVAQSQVVQGEKTIIHPEKILPKLRQASPEFVRQFEGFLIQMVSDNKSYRPDLSICLTQLAAFESAYNLIETSEGKIKQADEKVRHLQRQLSQLKQSNSVIKTDAKTQNQIDQLKREGAKNERILQETLDQNQLALNGMKEAQKKELDGMMKVQKMALDKEKEINRKLQRQTVLLERRAETAESGQKHISEKLQKLTVEVEQLTGEAKKMEASLYSKGQQLDGLTGEVVEARAQRRQEKMARVSAEEKITKYELELATKKEDHLKAVDKLKDIEAKKKKLELEKISQAEMVQELSSRLSHRLKAPLDGLRYLASNRDGVDKSEFGSKISGVLMGLPSDPVRVQYLNDLAAFIFCNDPDVNGVKPYTHQSAYFRHLSFHRRQQVDFTTTQLEHMTSVVKEAEKLAINMLNGDDEAKHRACLFLREGLATRVQASDVLTSGYGWAESLLASTHGISKYQLTKDEQVKLLKSELGDDFQDGRRGSPGKNKMLTSFMQGLENMGEVDAAKRLLEALPAKEPLEQLIALEREFMSILARPKAYTRGESGTVAWLAESMWEKVTGEKRIREDIDSPSATKMRHIALLGAAYSQALQQLMDEKLSPGAVEVLSDSHLVKFSPAQYQHELSGFQNNLMYKVTTLLESEQNFETYKNYLRQKYTAKFDTA